MKSRTGEKQRWEEESEKRREEEERRSQKRKSQKKEDPGARKGRKVAKAPEGRKVGRSLKRRVRSQLPSMRDGKVHAVVA